MQFDKDLKSEFKLMFLKAREILLSYEGIVETKKERITTYSNNKGGICHMRTMPYGIDFGFLKGAKMEDKNGVLTGKGKAIRVLPQKGELDEKTIKYFINQAIEINANKQISSVDQILDILKKEADPQKILIKETKFGITANNALGIYHKELKEIAKKIPKKDTIAIQLFNSGIYEARLLCSKIFNPENLTEQLMDEWMSTFENWEICDSFCMGLFAKSKYAIPKAIEWSKRTKEFEKRAGFTTIAAYCMADKEANNDTFEQFFHIIKREATDERIYVKKAVNWALRNIGKRNIDLKSKAISLAEEILKMDDKTAKWIANNALKELKSDNIRISDYPRKVYRKK